MRITNLLEKPFLCAVNHFYANLPQQLPEKRRLQNCRIISHRGEHDNKIIFENTIPAFDLIKEQCIWGIEFDIRWTKDLHPVVFHDKNLKRLFRSDIEIRQVTLGRLKTEFPLIPSLAEVIGRYGKKLHLMIEIKEEIYPDPVYQNSLLQDLFSSLEPEKDFHFISLSPDMFKLIDFVPATTFLPIAQLNIKQLSKIAIKENYGGIFGHYLFLTKAYLKKHQMRNQIVGTGFIDSKYCLFRELNRGIEWIFSNKAVEIQSIRNFHLEKV